MQPYRRRSKYNNGGGVGALMGPTLSIAVSSTYRSSAYNYPPLKKKFCPKTLLGFKPAGFSY